MKKTKNKKNNQNIVSAKKGNITHQITYDKNVVGVLGIGKYGAAWSVTVS